LLIAFHEFIGKQELLEQEPVSPEHRTFRFVPAICDVVRVATRPVTDYLNELNARIATALRLSGGAFGFERDIEDRYCCARAS